MKNQTANLLASAKAGTALLREWIDETITDDKDIDSWMENGRWAESPSEFVRSFFGIDIERERKGRTDEELAQDLVLELAQEKKRNRVKRFVIETWLDEGKPINADEQMLAWEQLEDVVDKILEAL